MTEPEKLRAATCQFPMSADIDENARHIEGLMRDASANGAHLVHFSEGALSGYLGSELFSWDGYDWSRLRSRTHDIMALAQRLKLWTILGSAHFLDDTARPTNCLYIIAPTGEVVDRYDKCMLTDVDQLSYTGGRHSVVMDIHGVRCGFLICYDVAFPEVYAWYRARGAQLVFHSFHNAGYGQATVLDELGHPWVQVRAADNKMWIVANNNAREHQSWTTCIARPDGSIAKRMERHATGMLIHDFPDEELVGWTHNDKPIRLAPDEIFHRGETVEHPRRLDRRSAP